MTAPSSIQPPSVSETIAEHDAFKAEVACAYRIARLALWAARDAFERWKAQCYRAIGKRVKGDTLKLDKFEANRAVTEWQTFAARCAIALEARDNARRFRAGEIERAPHGWNWPCFYIYANRWRTERADRRRARHSI